MATQWHVQARRKGTDGPWHHRDFVETDNGELLNQYLSASEELEMGFEYRAETFYPHNEIGMKQRIDFANKFKKK